MKFPKWAPQVLVDEYHSKVAIEIDNAGGGYHDPENTLNKIIKASEKSLSDERIEVLRLKLNRESALPYKESIEQLQQLISDPRMKKVWSALESRFNANQLNDEAIGFVHACEEGIVGWRSTPKQTTSQHRKLYQEIQETANELKKQLREASMFDDYSITALVDTASIEQMTRPNTNAEEDNIFFQFCLKESLPAIEYILSDIIEKASAYEDRLSSVKKPNSTNAELHFFIRLLCQYLTRNYGQPLYEVVAITTSVIFNTDTDEDYVREIRTTGG